MICINYYINTQGLKFVNGDRVEALAAFSLNEHCAMIEKVEAEEICQKELSEAVANIGELLQEHAIDALSPHPLAGELVERLSGVPKQLSVGDGPTLPITKHGSSTQAISLLVLVGSILVHLTRQPCHSSSWKSPRLIFTRYSLPAFGASSKAYRRSA